MLVNSRNYTPVGRCSIRARHSGPICCADYSYVRGYKVFSFAGTNSPILTLCEQGAGLLSRRWETGTIWPIVRFPQRIRRGSAISSVHQKFVIRVLVWQSTRAVLDRAVLDSSDAQQGAAEQFSTCRIMQIQILDVERSTLELWTTPGEGIRRRAESLITLRD